MRRNNYRKLKKKMSDNDFAKFALSNSPKLLSNFPAMIKANKLGLRVLSIKVDDEIILSLSDIIQWALNLGHKS